MPYSVTTYITSVRGVVTMLPGVSVGPLRSPFLSSTDERQRKDLPPFEE